MIPMRKPDATIAGMIGTKMSPSVLMARWEPVALLRALRLGLVLADGRCPRQRDEFRKYLIDRTGAKNDL